MSNYFFLGKDFLEANPWFNNFVDWIAENKAAPMTWGAGFSLGSEKPEVDKFLRDFKRKNNIGEFFFKYEATLSKYGAGVVFFDKDNILRMANPIFPIFTGGVNEEPDVISCVESNREFAWTGNIYKTIKISKEGIEVSRGGMIGVVPVFFWTTEDPKFKEDEISKPQILGEYYPNKNKDGLNAVWMMNITKYNPTLVGLNWRRPDWLLISQTQFEDLSHAYEAIIDDIMVSRNKLILYDDDEKNSNVQKKLEAETNPFLKRYYKSLGSIILRSQKRGMAGKEAGTDFLKGSPNSAILWENFWHQWELLSALAGYSTFKDNSNYATATSTRQSKDLDMITSDYKKNLREKQWNKLFDRLMIENGFWDGNNERPYYFKIHNTPITNKEEGLEKIKKMEDFGYITKADAIMMLFPNYDKADAEAKMKEITKEREEFPEISTPSNVETGEAEDQNYGGNQQKKLQKPSSETAKKQEKNNEGK